MPMTEGDGILMVKLLETIIMPENMKNMTGRNVEKSTQILNERMSVKEWE
jgi:hypothetical protein